MYENCQLIPATLGSPNSKQLNTINFSTRTFVGNKKQRLASYNSIKNSTFYFVIKLNGNDGEVFTT